jgi:glycine/D-amino acid oxidase-like deaminating enzyme
MTLNRSFEHIDGHRCLWRATAPEPPPSGHLSGETAADVVVIGGGFTGLSAALHLAQGGAKTVLLEARDIGYGGSGRNVGLVNAGLWIKPSAVLETLGRDYGQRLISLLSEAPKLVFDLVAEHGIQCEASHTGTLHCAPDRRGATDLRERADEWIALGAPVRLLSADETSRLTGTSLYRCGLLDERAGTIQPLAYARGLARAAIAAGTRLFTQSAVKSWQRAGARWQVETERGRVQADWIVVATGAYTLGLTPALRTQQVHLPYFNFATDPLPQELRASVLPGINGIWDTLTVLRSIRRDRDGRLIVGSVGSVAGWHQGVHRAWASRLMRKAYPQLRGLEFTYAWDGVIDMTADRVPHLHKMNSHILCITGYNGRGIAPGTTLGRMLAGHILGKMSEQELPIPESEPRAATSRLLQEPLYRMGSLAAHWFL